MKSSIEGYTPVINEIAHDVGLVAAAVYGEMWRYAQQSPMEICTASQTKIGKRINVARETVNRKIKELIDKGYVKEVGRSGGTVTYAPLIHIYQKHSLGVTENHNESDGESQQGVTEDHTNKALKKDNNIKRNPSSKQELANAIQEGANLNSMVRSDFQEHLGLTPQWHHKDKQDLMTFFRERYEEGQTVKQFADWWRKEDWRGQKGQPPDSARKVKEKWFQAFSKQSTAPPKASRVIR